MSGSGHCFLCLEREELVTCPACQLVRTCNQHQHLHYNQAGGCYSFKVEYQEEVGRYLVATRRINQGEVIYRDRPAVIGPNMSNTEAHCVGCLRLGCEEECEACGFPVCDKICAGAPHHHQECQIFQEAGYRYEGTAAYSAVTVLRLLLVMEGRDQTLLEMMMDHNQERRLEHPEVWSFEKQFVVSHLHDKLGLRSRFSEEQIHRVAGILSTNSTTLQFPSEDHVKGNGLYPVYSMMNHSCSCNTKTIIDSAAQFEMTIMANVELSAGDQITNQYMKPDKPSLYRRPLLREKWHFDCWCTRCLDPTELGSHLSSLRCPRRGSRRQCEGTVLLTSPTSTSSDWACQYCGLVINNQQAFNILEQANSIQEEALDCLHTIDTDHNGNVIKRKSRKNADQQQVRDGEDLDRRGLSALEEAVFSLSSLLHHSNYFIIQVKLKLISLYEGAGSNLTRTELQRQVQLCSEVMECLARIDSGYSEWRTRILPALGRAKMMAAHRDLQRGIIPKTRFDKLVMENRFMILYLAYQHAKVRV